VSKTNATGPRPWPYQAKRECEGMVADAQDIRAIVRELMTGDAILNRYLLERRLIEIERNALAIELAGTRALSGIRPQETP
jgi:hypothetical protein